MLGIVAVRYFHLEILTFHAQSNCSKTSLPPSLSAAFKITILGVPHEWTDTLIHEIGATPFAEGYQPPSWSQQSVNLPQVYPLYFQRVTHERGTLRRIKIGRGSDG